MRPTDDSGTYTGKTVRFLRNRQPPIWVYTTAAAALFILLAVLLISILLS